MLKKTKIDGRIEDILRREKNRQERNVQLIASENFASQEVMELCGSVFTNKYAEGYPGKRYYNGCEHMDEIEQLAIETVTDLYSCQFANVQPHCGANANTAIYSAFLKPGDKIMGMNLASGGHLSHGAPVNISGKFFDACHYGVDEEGWIDMNEVEDIAMKNSPKMIIAGASAYPREIDFLGFRRIADKCGAYLLVDMAHYSGLIAGTSYINPLKFGADFVTSTTHKTLRGPRGGMILWNDPEYTRKINSAVFPGTQGGPLMNMIAAKAQCFIEASNDDFKRYSFKVIANARTMVDIFKKRGYSVQTNGTDSHIILLNFTDMHFTGRQAADKLQKNGITVNKNGVPNDPRNFIETSGIRIGTAAETTRGWDSQWFADLADRICDVFDTI